MAGLLDMAYARIGCISEQTRLILNYTLDMPSPRKQVDGFHMKTSIVTDWLQYLTFE